MTRPWNRQPASAKLVIAQMKNNTQLDTNQEVLIKQNVPVQFECIWPIAMGGILFQIFWEVDDLDGIKWAFLQQELITEK